MVFEYEKQKESELNYRGLVLDQVPLFVIMSSSASSPPLITTSVVKIKENTGIVKLTLLCRCSLFLASIGWAKATFVGFDKFAVGVLGLM